MRWLLTFLVASLAGLTYGLSSTGNRLLVVIDDVADQSKYSQFWGDLEGIAIHWKSPSAQKILINGYRTRVFTHI